MGILLPRFATNTLGSSKVLQIFRHFLGSLLTLETSAWCFRPVRLRFAKHIVRRGFD